LCEKRPWVEGTMCQILFPRLLSGERSVGIDGGHLIGGQLSAADDSYDYSHCGRSRSNQHPCLLVTEFVVALMDALSVREVPNPSMIHRSG